ncbi:hypothetical protein LOK49_LG01G01277 [Camellia lanceoleosa]|uniref:Uncharacterized protein n=1 Tax=Camellia lanceoleosa TaxID=1840588 RepID=A0ACC0IY93_9ERIC|nr:hypothetical protein LOK49_LG01G01277 [Camellia lanceoleosa]
MEEKKKRSRRRRTKEKKESNRGEGKDSNHREGEKKESNREEGEEEEEEGEEKKTKHTWSWNLDGGWMKRRRSIPPIFCPNLMSFALEFPTSSVSQPLRGCDHISDHSSEVAIS